MMYGTGMAAGGWLLMGLFWAALLALIVWLVVKLLPAGNRQAPGADPASPEEILDRRFAAGEIDEQTYRTQRAVLASTRGRDR